METVPETLFEYTIVSILLKPISGESVSWLLAGHGDISAENAQMWLSTLEAAEAEQTTGESETVTVILGNEGPFQRAQRQVCIQGHIWTLWRGNEDRSDKTARGADSDVLVMLERLASHVSHDLYNFMTAVLGAASLLRRRLAEDDHRLSHVLQLESAISSSRKRFQGMTLLSDNDSSGHAPFGLRALVSQSLHGLRSRYPDAPVHVVDDGVDYAANGHEDVLRFVIAHVLENGCEATANERTCEVSFEATTDGYVVVRCFNEGGFLSKAVLERAFYPTFSGWDRKRRGMGLSIGWILMKRIGGDLTLTQREDGVECSIIFPRSDEAKRVGHGPVLPAERQEILLVQSDPNTRKLYRIAAESSGMEVHEASFGRASVVLCKAVRTPLVAVLIELSSLEQPLSEWVSEIRDAQPQSFVLFLCEKETEILPAWLEIGLSERNFLRKPFTPGDLMAVIRAEISGASD